MSVFLTVQNRTGAAATAVRPGDPSIVSAGNASLGIGIGPVPGVYNLLANSANATFKWSGRITGAGEVSVSVGATGIGLGGVDLSTGEVECGTVGIEEPPPPPFDPTQLIARCTAGAYDGPVLISFRLEVVNGTGGDLTDVTPFGPSIETTGTVELNVVSGPQPRSLRVLRDTKSARFKWQGNGEGRGLGFVHVGVTATGPGGEVVTTGLIECNTLVIPPRP